MNWFFRRLQEGSTWAGLAALVTGVGSLAKINEAPQIADALSGAGQAIAGGMDPITAVVVAVGGAAAMLLKDKGRR